MRISRGRVTAIVAAAVVVVIAMVLLVKGGDEDEQRIVKLSTSSSYPARGALIENQKLLEGAARAWRDDRDNLADSADRPGAVIDTLYAGRISGERIATGPDRDLLHDVVIFSSGPVIGTVTRPKGGDWEVRDTKRFRVASTVDSPILDVGAGLYLMADDRFSETVPAVGLPRQISEDAEVQDDSGDPQAFTVDLEDPLWKPNVSTGGPVAVRLPGDKEGTYVGLVWLDLESLDVSIPLVTRTAGGAGQDDRLWEQLVSKADSAGTTAAFETAIDALKLRQDNAPSFDGIVRNGFSIRSLGTTTLRDTPEGDRVAHGLALGYGADGDADVVTVGLTGKDIKGTVRTKGVVIGERPAKVREAVPIAARWITPDVTGPYYLIYAADPDLDRLQLHVGSETVDTQGSLGYYVPPTNADSGARLPTTLIGYDKDGVTFPSFPIGAQ